MPSEIGHHRIRRAKSAPSVQKRRQLPSTPTPLDSEIARHHATAAASLAMTQARDRMAHVSPQKTARSSNEETTAVPSTRTFRRRPSITSLTREHNPNAISHTFAPTQAIYESGKEKSSPADLSSVREFQGFSFEEELSAPSSYRRLRKSRSMFSTRSMRNLRNAGIPLNRSEEAESPSLRASMESTTEPHRSLRKSLSFFNGASQSIRRMRSHGAISTRRQHLSKFEDEPPVPPLPALSDERPVRKPLRTTVRTLRELSPDEGVLPASTSGRFHCKARSFSITIKKRLKRVFGIPGYAEGQPSEVHSVDSPSHDDDVILDSPTIIERTPRPSLHRVKSSESIATSTSRVTSWTNSTAGNTVRTRNTIDRHSLSTIEESCDLVNQQPPDLDVMYESGNVRNQRGNMIDSRQVYSALLRHIGETAAKDGDRIVSTGTVKGSPVIMERSPSIQIHRDHGSIHKIPSDLSMITARTSFFTEPRQHSPQSPLSLRSQSFMTDRTVTSAEKKQTSRLSSGASPKVTLRESRSLFFPSGTSPNLKTSSPYRAAMNSIRETEDDSDRDTPSIIITGTDNDKLAATSPSIYSRTPSGPAISREDLGYESDESVEPGVATIYDAQVPYRSPRRHQSQASETGSSNSAEWMRWVNCQVDTIGNSDVSNLDSEREHHREDSECDGEPIQVPPIESVILGNANRNRDNSLSRIRQICTSQQVCSTPDTEITVQGQNNFSRPLSRQSMISLRTLNRQSSFTGRRQCLYQGTDLNLTHKQKDYQPDPFFNESPEESSSATRRQTMRAARQARLSRGNIRRNTFGHADDQQDARSVQFRSIREMPSFGTRNKENEISPSIKGKIKTTSAIISGIEDIHQTINRKSMVDVFLEDRRGRRRNSVTSEGISSVFI